MSIKENLLKWLANSAQKQHRASSVEDKSQKEEKESQPPRKQVKSAKEAKVHQDFDPQ